MPRVPYGVLNTDDEPCRGNDKFNMCIYDLSKDKASNKCQTVEQLEEQLHNGDELIKCGKCSKVDFDIYSYTNSKLCSDEVPCGATDDGEYMYPVCIYNTQNKSLTSQCRSISGPDDLSNPHEVYRKCGFCDKPED